MTSHQNFSNGEGQNGGNGGQYRRYPPVPMTVNRTGGQKRTRTPCAQKAAPVAIGKSYATLHQADKFLLKGRESGRTFMSMKKEFEQLWGQPVAASTLPNRYNKIKENLSGFSNQDDHDLLVAKKTVESMFESSKWEVIAEVMSRDGSCKQWSGQQLLDRWTSIQAANTTMQPSRGQDITVRRNQADRREVVVKIAARSSNPAREQPVELHSPRVEELEEDESESQTGERAEENNLNQSSGTGPGVYVGNPHQPNRSASPGLFVTPDPPSPERATKRPRYLEESQIESNKQLMVAKEPTPQSSNRTDSEPADAHQLHYASTVPSSVETPAESSNVAQELPRLNKACSVESLWDLGTSGKFAAESRHQTQHQTPPVPEIAHPYRSQQTHEELLRTNPAYRQSYMVRQQALQNQTNSAQFQRLAASHALTPVGNFNPVNHQGQRDLQGRPAPMSGAGTYNNAYQNMGYNTHPGMVGPPYYNYQFMGYGNGNGAFNYSQQQQALMRTGMMGTNTQDYFQPSASHGAPQERKFSPALFQGSASASQTASSQKSVGHGATQPTSATPSAYAASTYMGNSFSKPLYSVFGESHAPPSESLAARQKNDGAPLSHSSSSVEVGEAATEGAAAAGWEHVVAAEESGADLGEQSESSASM